MSEVTLSSKNQVVIPKEARVALGLKAGDRLVAVLKGDHVILVRKPRRFSDAIRGLVPEGYSGRYLGEERDEWDSRK
jgi:AbrB family looped-hinge helix DNA binding protein